MRPSEACILACSALTASVFTSGRRLRCSPNYPGHLCLRPSCFAFVSKKPCLFKFNIQCSLCHLQRIRRKWESTSDLRPTVRALAIEHCSMNSRCSAAELPRGISTVREIYAVQLSSIKQLLPSGVPDSTLRVRSEKPAQRHNFHYLVTPTQTGVLFVCPTLPHGV